MYRLWIENENNKIMELTNSTSFIVTDVDGLLPPDTTINSVEAVNKDGSIYNSSKVNNRPINITILPQNPVEENRQKLYEFFKVKKAVTIYFKNKNRDVKITGRLQKFDGSLFSQTQTLTLEIICNDPYFKDKDDSTQNMSQIIDNFEFPFAIAEEGKEFSYIDKVITKVIENNGDVEAGLIITLRAEGEVVDPIIYDVDTREKFGLNFTMQKSDLIQINTNKGNKKVELVRNNVTTNIINSIMKGNKWLELKNGDNLFTYDCKSGAEYLYISFCYANLYEGV